MFFRSPLKRLGSRRFHRLPLGTEVIINGEIGEVSGHNTDPKDPLTTVLFIKRDGVRIDNVTKVKPPKRDGVEVIRFRDKLHRRYI